MLPASGNDSKRFPRSHMSAGGKSDEVGCDAKVIEQGHRSCGNRQVDALRLEMRQMTSRSEPTAGGCAGL